MKISYNWLRNYADFDWAPDALGHHLTMAGLEVEGTEAWESVPGGLRGVVVGEVITCEKHPNADKLRVTTVNVGGPELLHIVCGAPNVAAGQKVPVALVGTTLHTFSGEEITLKKTKIRGETSEGMICAEDELGIGQGHDGIMVLDPSLKPGTPMAEVLGVESDHVLEIGLTANRADAASHFGVARDIAALVRRPVKLPAIPEVSKELYAAPNPITIEIRDAERCPRYTGIYIKGVVIAESPAWLQNRLKAIGLRPISNVVDITNFVMHELGQPLHAFDADRIGGNTIIVQTMPPVMGRPGSVNTRFRTLDGTERDIVPHEDLMICDGEKPVAIAGVMGGENSEVSQSTVNILLESACFHSASVRRTAKRLGLKTDASYRFERGTDPNGVLRAAMRAAALIAEIAGGEITAVTDVQKTEFPPFEVVFSISRACRMMGRNFTEDELTSLLAMLEIKAEKTADADVLLLRVPRYRVDVQRPQDVMEEILRIFGYNNIPVSSEIRFTHSGRKQTEPLRLKEKYFDYLAAAGYQELIANPLVPAKHNHEQHVSLINNLSEDLAVLRPDMLITGLSIIEFNHNRKNYDLRLAEYGKTYSVQDGKYDETDWVVWYLTGKKAPEHWSGKSAHTDFFTLSGEMNRLMQWFGFNGEFAELQEPNTWDFGLSLVVNKQTVVRFGRVAASHLKGRDIKGDVYYGIADWKQLVKLYNRAKEVYREPARFPEMHRDISMLVPDGLSFAKISSAITRCNPKLIRHVGITDVYRGDKIEKGTKSYLVNLTLLDEEQTLTDTAADKVMERVFSVLEKDLGAVIRKG